MNSATPHPIPQSPDTQALEAQAGIHANDMATLLRWETLMVEQGGEPGCFFQTMGGLHAARMSGGAPSEL